MKFGLLFIGLLAIVVADPNVEPQDTLAVEAPAQLVDEPFAVDEPENGESTREKRTLLLKKKLLLKKALLFGG